MTSTKPTSAGLVLVIHRGDQRIGEIPLTGQEVKVGRGAENAIRLEDPKVSRVHARFHRVQDRYWVEDQGSANRTFVNGRPEARASLAPGDNVEVGPFRITLEVAVPATAPVIEEATSHFAPGEAASPPGPKAKELDLLVSVIDTLDVETSRDQVLGRVLDALLAALDGERAFLYRYDSRHTSVRRVLEHHRTGADPGLPVSDSVADRAARERTPVMLTDLENPGPDDQSVVRLAEGKIQSVIAAPLLTGRKLSGVIYIDSRTSRRSFTTGDLEVLARTCGYLARTMQVLDSSAELSRENQRLRKIAEGRAPTELPMESLVAPESAFRQTIELIDRAAVRDVTVLITGETGTGKEETARRIHRMSSRSGQTFLAVNCGAIPEALLESELFGYRKGAFTGANEDRPGVIENAAGGILFLDEVGELPLPAQVKLLRVLEERRVQRIGATDSIPVDFRLLSATHRDLKRSVDDGRFRQDLYYRLKVLEIELPSLRERIQDIPLIVDYLIAVLAGRLESPVRGATPETLEVLARHPWPGNIRELKNVLERALVFEDSTRLTPASLPPEVNRSATAARAATPAAPAPAAPASPGGPVQPYQDELRHFERDYFRRLRRQVGANISAMSRVSGISRYTLYRKLGEQGLGDIGEE